MRWVFGHDEAVAAWVALKMSIPTEFFHYSAIGLEIDGEPAAAVVYHNYIPVFKDLEISCAISNPRAAHPNTAAAFLRYPFLPTPKGLGCNRVTAKVSSDNLRSIKLIEGIGFKREGRLKNGCGNKDMIIYGLSKKDAKKWIERKKR